MRRERRFSVEASSCCCKRRAAASSVESERRASEASVEFHCQASSSSSRRVDSRASVERRASRAILKASESERRRKRSDSSEASVVEAIRISEASDYCESVNLSIASKRICVAASRLKRRAIRASNFSVVVEASSIQFSERSERASHCSEAIQRRASDSVIEASPTSQPC